MKQTVRKGVTKDRQKYLSTVTYDDIMTGGAPEKLCAIASNGMLC